MKPLLALCLSLISWCAYPAVFHLVPVNLGNGYALQGTLETNVGTGPVAAANIVAWNITVTQTTDQLFTPKTSPNKTVLGVSSDGSRLWVQRSPDTVNFIDGGSLSFSGTAGRGSIPPTVVVADFTSTYNWYYPDSIVGGVAGWMSEIAGMNLAAPVSQAPCSARTGACRNYAAASIVPAKPNVFRIRPVTIQTTPTVMTLSGTITTDGTLGQLTAGHIVDWRLRARDQDIQTYTEQNSQLLNVAGLNTDGTTLSLDNPGGILEIGLPTTNPFLLGISVKIADFADPAYPGGIASYFFRNFGLLAQKAPLTGSPNYVVAKP